MLLELPPVAKGRPRFGNGRTFTPKKTKDFEDRARQLMTAQFFMVPLEGPLRVELSFMFEKPKRAKHETLHIVRPDLDNLIKSVCDAAVGIVYVDDAQVCEILAKKVYCKEGTSPRILFSVTSIDYQPK